MYIWFDEIYKTQKGKKVPFYTFTTVDHAEDGAVAWFHERHGLMKLYKIHKVDAENFIAEDMHQSKYNWEIS